MATSPFGLIDAHGGLQLATAPRLVPEDDAALCLALVCRSLRAGHGRGLGVRCPCAAAGACR